LIKLIFGFAEFDGDSGIAAARDGADKKLMMPVITKAAHTLPKMCFIHVPPKGKIKSIGKIDKILQNLLYYNNFPNNVEAFYKVFADSSPYIQAGEID
jgi:hypothetical protein